MSNESNICRHCYSRCQISKGAFWDSIVIKRQGGPNCTWDVSLEIPRRGETTHFFEVNRAIAIKVLRKYIMEGHIENGSGVYQDAHGEFHRASRERQSWIKETNEWRSRREQIRIHRLRCLCYNSAGPGGNLRKRKAY